MVDRPNQPKPQPTDKTEGSGIVTSIRDLLIIIVSIIAIAVVLVVVLGKFTTSTDVVAVLGATLPVVSTIAAAAFGVSVGTSVGSKAGASAGNERANAAREANARLKDA